MRPWRWSLSASATASPFSPCYSCRFRVPLSLNNFSLSAPSISPSSCKISTGLQFQHFNENSNVRKRKRVTGFEAVARNVVKCTSGTNTELDENEGLADFDGVGTGHDVECVVSSSDSEESVALSDDDSAALGRVVWEWAVLVSPFFFWGTAMVAMKEVIPKCGPFFVSAFRLIPAGFLLVAFAASRNRPFPSGLTAWLSISLFALVDATCFQGFLAEGLQRTSAGLGSVIIDSQPLTVAILAALLFGESIGFVGAAGLVLGVVGLLLLEVPALAFDTSNFSLWGSGEWWMLLAAQSMAIGTVMVRWVSKYSDPVMATGWHMVIGGLPLVIFCILNDDPVVNGSLKEFTATDVVALLYTSIFGSAVSYGVYFYSATKGSLTKLSSFTFLTPMFASIFGFIYLGETFSPVQLVGAVVTLVAIYMVNYRNVVE
ncbi:WAT1-related protein At3g02690, chloroplastic isoform X2 [Corylus avellana]|uniref:WAT1-related protein At3g02690, chloroplastic isoform X1 n=2 Tax=Corylus avellana TaxID=13451 RepID=UPI00286C15D1|nr:WAT1-related protein At3g02690, chloroplastic isoform X1 [Corylus avellana]XP_059451979.1 WAT1-related protein At3g02690, chloroplastic isoform X2 [Corylus avellana]